MPDKGMPEFWSTGYKFTADNNLFVKTKRKQLELPETADGEPIYPHHCYYGGDGIHWHICAVNEHHVYGYDANRPEPEVTKHGQYLKRLRPEWLTVKKPEPDMPEKAPWADAYEEFMAAADKLMAALNDN